MKIKVGINGFGRIGRLAARILGEGHDNLELVAINSRAKNQSLAHLLKYDSVHRTYIHSVDYDDDCIIINNKKVYVTHYDNPKDIPWKDFDVEIVLEATGIFKKAENTLPHISNGGAKKVVIGAPSKDSTPVFVFGVNHKMYDPKSMDIISNASCTTNCLAPIVKVINEAFKIEYGLMTTVHAYTMSQRMLDGSANDIRRARAAAISMVPTSTGAARSLGRVLPEMDGKFDGFAIRVPTPDVSLMDLNCRIAQNVSVKEINDALKSASEDYLKNVMTVTNIPLVSIDYVSSPYSAVVDSLLTMVMNGRMLKILAWYDNEMGFAQRFVDLTDYVACKM